MFIALYIITPRYSRNTVKVGVKHHSINQCAWLHQFSCFSSSYYFNIFHLTSNNGKAFNLSRFKSVSIRDTLQTWASLWSCIIFFLSILLTMLIHLYVSVKSLVYTCNMWSLYVSIFRFRFEFSFFK